MMKGKQLLSLLLLMICMVVAVLPMGASAAELASGTCGENLTWVLDQNLTLTITGTGDMADYERFSTSTLPPWSDYQKQIVRVVIGEGVTSIGDSAFYDCERLASVDWPNTILEIGTYAFCACDNLDEVSIPEGVKTIGEGAFASGGIRKLTIPKSVTVLGRLAFYGCYYLEELHYNIASLDTANSGDNLFVSAGNYIDGTNVYFGADVESIPDNLFYYDEKDYGYIPNILSVTFAENSKCERIGEKAFHKLSKLQTISLPDSITEIGANAFESCTSLLTVHLPETLTTIGKSAFTKCSALTAVRIPETVTSIGQSAFYYCEALVSANIPEGITVLEPMVFYRCFSLQSIQIPENMTSIGADAFSSCSSLTSITIPEKITSIGAEAFAYCYALREVNFNASAAKDASYNDNIFLSAGKNSGNLVLKIGSKVKYIPEYMFSCNTIGSNYYFHVTDVVFAEDSICKSIGYDAFDGCDKLRNVTLPDSLETISMGAFSGCTELRNVNIPKNVTEIGNFAFSSCFELENIYFDAVAMNDLAADNNVFHNGSYSGDGITVTIGSNVTRIPAYLFNPDSGDGSPKITSVIFEDGSNCQSIGMEAFAHCDDFSEIILPEALTEIGLFAFDSCAALSDVVFTGNAPAIGTYAFSDVTANCYYPQDDSSWTPDVMQDYGGTLTWTAKKFCKHEYESVTTSPTCTEMGYTTHICTICGDSYVDTYVDPLDHKWNDATCTEPKTCSVCGETEGEALGHNFADGKCTICGDRDPDYVPPVTDPEPTDPQIPEPTDPPVPEVTGATRIFGATRYDTAFKAADQLKANLGIEKFENIVVAYGEDFADALSGSYLANQKNAPILLVKNRNKEINLVKDYIKSNLTPGGTVYLLGGVNAVPKAMETGMEGFNVKRLAGATRYETNLEILKEAGISGNDILVCTGLDFADGLSASAVNKPILLVKDSLRATQVNYLKTLGTKNFYLIGGTNAVNKRIEYALAAYGTTQRIEGATRYYTSVNIAKTFFPNAKTAVLAYAQNFPDGLSGGCLACSMNAPLILTANGKQAPAVAYAKEAGISGGAVLGGTGLIPDRVANAIFQIS